MWCWTKTALSIVQFSQQCGHLSCASETSHASVPKCTQSRLQNGTIAKTFQRLAMLLHGRNGKVCNTMQVEVGNPRWWLAAKLTTTSPVLHILFFVQSSPWVGYSYLVNIELYGHNGLIELWVRWYDWMGWADGPRWAHDGGLIPNISNIFLWLLLLLIENKIILLQRRCFRQAVRQPSRHS